MPGEHRRARRSARWRGAKGMGEENPFTCNPIEMGRLDDFLTVSSRVRPAPIVRDAEEDVGPLVRSIAGGNQEQCAKNDE